jgi:hypothetical protein
VGLNSIFVLKSKSPILQAIDFPYAVDAKTLEKLLHVDFPNWKQQLMV